MKIVDKKPAETSANYFYGVDVNDREAVQKEFERLQKQHKTVTIIVIVVLIILAIIFFDFFRVNYIGGKPIFAIESKVERGTMFSGLGYKVLYCENGERYIGSVLYKTCEEIEENKFSNIVYENLVNYSIDKKMLDKDNLESFNINSLTFDENNDEGGSDYYLNISYVCKDGSVKCFKTEKEFYDNLNVNLYVRINKYNEIYDVIYFKSTGEKNKTLTKMYTENIKTYLIENNMMDVDNLRDYSIKLVKNYGKYKFRSNVYADSYLVEINYMCNDNTNNCIIPFDRQDQEGDFANLSFYASVFLDVDNKVLLMGPKEYFDL